MFDSEQMMIHHEFKQAFGAPRLIKFVMEAPSLGVSGALEWWGACRDPSRGQCPARASSAGRFAEERDGHVGVVDGALRHDPRHARILLQKP